MAEEEGSRANARKQPGKLTYFYLNGLLHKSLHINRGADKITTWCYPEHRRVAYTYSDVKKNREPAYTTQEVAQMLNRTRKTIEYAIMDGNIEPPQFTYRIGGGTRQVQVHVGRGAYSGSTCSLQYRSLWSSTQGWPNYTQTTSHKEGTTGDDSPRRSSVREEGRRVRPRMESSRFRLRNRWQTQRT